MEESVITGITAIQAILAPALGISATALIMLSVSNRYSLTINRIRLLNEERRRYTLKIADASEGKAGKVELSYTENVRFSNVVNQLQKLLIQCKELRNSVLFLQISIMLFVLSSLAIGVNLFISTNFMKNLPVVLFSIGMIFVLLGIAFSAVDVIKSFRVAKIEVQGDE